MGNYYRVCKSLKDKGVLIEEGADLDQYKSGEAYVSVYKYNDEHKKLFDKNGSVAGITDVKTDIIYFDFDNTDLDIARNDTITTVERLKGYGIDSDDMKIAFSAGKGFHLSLHTKSEFTPEEAKNLAIKVSGDLKSFDSSIYNANRIIRLEGSVHNKTGLRKTALTYDELQTLKIADIKDLARDEYDYVKPPKLELTEGFLKLKEPVLSKSQKEGVTIFDNVDYLSNPYHLQPWKLALSQGFFPNGNRSNALMILGSTLKNKGLLKEQCHHALRAAADLQAERYGAERFSKTEIWENIVEQIYNQTWKGGSYAEENFPTQLQQYFEEMGIPRKEESDLVEEKYKPTKLHDVSEVFENFVKNYEKNVIKTGIDPIDKDIPLTPGMNLGIIGAPGAGKTSLALKMLEYCSENNIHCILASIDMNSTRLYEKVLYRVSGLSREDLYEKIRNGEADSIKEKVRELFKTVYIYDKSAATIDDIRKYHRSIEKRDDVEIKMTMVDYFERVNSDVSDDTASSKKVAGQWQDYINDFNIVGIMFVQPNKISLSGGPNSPILDYRAIKGSSFLYQSFRGIISLWRPFYTPETASSDKYMQMALLKNDLGELNMYDFGWDGKRGEIFELDDEGKFILKNLLEDSKNNDEDDF